MFDSQHERIVWQGFPSWGYFSWLYLFIVLTASRGIVFLRFGVPGWQIWIFSACLLLVVVALIRRWTYYVVTPTCVTMKNGYTQGEIISLKLEMIRRVDLVQGPLAKCWQIGTLVIQASNNGRELRLRGVKYPEVVGAKIRALLPATLREN